MSFFSYFYDYSENIGELVLEMLLSSNIDSITSLNFSQNSSWFDNSDMNEDRSANVDLLAEFISKQLGIQYIDLSGSLNSSNATKKILTRIADFGSSSKL